MLGMPGDQLLGQQGGEAAAGGERKQVRGGWSGLVLSAREPVAACWRALNALQSSCHEESNCPPAGCPCYS